MTGFVLLGLLALFAVVTPWLGQRPPFMQDLYGTLQAPSLAEPLGTDHLGRSLTSRLAQATRLSLGLAVLSVLTAAVPGTLLGIAAAWRGGWTERVLSLLADTALALPGLLLVLLLAAFAPGSLWPLYVGLSLVFWVEYYRVARARSRIILASQHVEAARLLGFGPRHLVWRHILPELAPMLGTQMSFGAGAAILALAAMGFIGLGAQPPLAELGLMMTELLPYASDAPWLMAAPIAVLATMILALALIGTSSRSGDIA